MPVNTDAFIGFAHELADAADVAIRPYFGGSVPYETKDDNSPVSMADKAAEAAMRELITSHYPDHGIYGEEHGTHHTDAQFVWVLDPIDGTRNFITGGTEWGTLIALCENGVPILGILDQPITGERWVGQLGKDTTKNGEPVHTRNCTALADAAISTTFCAPPDDARYAALAAQCRDQISKGDCYAYGLLAAGQRDIVCDTALKPYDILALVPIIEGAGGKITGWDGAPITLSHYQSALAAGDAAVHAAALNVLARG